MTKKERLDLICDLVSQYDIDTQVEIVDRLKEAGIKATQATVSRDIKELGIVKIPATGKSYVYGLPKTKNHQVSRQLTYIKSASSQGLMIHLDVEPGSTALVKRQLLGRFSQQIFSIISDDDSLLIVARTGTDMATFLQKIKE